MKMSITVILPDNKRLTVKSTIKDLLSEILEKVCEKKGLDSNKYSLHYNNKCLDPSLSLRFANIPLNSELYLVYDQNKKCDSELTISVQYEDKLRKTGQFRSSDSLWTVIETLFGDDIPQLNNEDLVFSINYLNKQFEGQSVLKKTTLKSLGISGRVILRLNCRTKGEEPTQKFVENLKFKKVEIRQPERPLPVEIKPEPQKDLPVEQPVPEKDPQVEKKLSDETKSQYFENLKQTGNSISTADLKSSPPVLNDAENSGHNDNQDTAEKKEVTWLGGKNFELLYSLDENITFVEDELPEEFFQHTAGDLKHLLAELKRQRSDSEEMLLTQQQRDDRKQALLNKYDRTILRVIFPKDRLVLQAIFKPKDLIKDVISVLSKYLEHSEVQLFVAPPKKILPADSSLFDLGLVPCGIVYCKSLRDDSSLIKNEFKSNVSTFSSVKHQAFDQMKCKISNTIGSHQ